MSFLQNESLNGVIATPISTPQIDLLAQGPGLPIFQFELLNGQQLIMPYLCLHFIQFKTLGFMEKFNSGLPIVYVGIYYQTLPGGDSPPGKPMVHLGTDVPGVVTLRRNSKISFTAPGVYRVQLFNNHASSTISALVTGVSQLLNVTPTTA